MSESGVVNIHGREYKTVAKRVQEFRENDAWLGCAIITELVSATDERVIMKASIVTEGSQTLATGFAEEVRGSTNINKTSALENAETSAIGRALACLGLAGTEYASADEVAGAISQQAAMEQEAYFLKYQEVVREHFGSIAAIKMYLADGSWSNAAEAESEIPRDDLVMLWKAPSKGGVWTTDERALLKSDEMNAARKEFAG